MSGATEYTYKKETVTEELKRFMKETYGDPREMTQEEKNAFFEKMGLMYLFVCEMFPE